MTVSSSARWMRTASLTLLRASVRNPRYRRLWILVAVAYIVISMFIGQMLVLYAGSSTISGVTVYTFTDPNEVASAYLVPAMIVIAPHVVLTLALWPTVVMVLIGLGIGLAVASAVSVLATQRARRADVAAGSAAPMVTGWALMGACCCSSCITQVAAVGAVGALVGSSPADLLRTSWPIGLLEIAIVAISLLYMERQLEGAPTSCTRVAASSSQQAVALVLRVLLLVASITWLFALVLEMTVTPVTDVTPALIYHWTFEHALLCSIGIVTAMAPELLWGWTVRSPRLTLVWRIPAVIAGVTWAIGVPAVLVAAGLGGFTNELLGFLGFSGASGAEIPDATLGAPLYFHWVFQHLILGGWAIVAAAVPNRAFSWASPSLRPVAIPAPSHGATQPRGPVVATEGLPPSPGGELS